MNKKVSNSRLLHWPVITGMMRRHKRLLINAHLLAVAGTLLAVPVPLLMPLLVDEVLLDQPGTLIAWLNPLLPDAWQTGVGYIHRQDLKR